MRPDPVIRVSCPWCDGLKTGRYHRRHRRFVCTAPTCPQFSEVTSYAEFEAEVERQLEDYFQAYPALLDGSSQDRVEEIARELLTQGVDPHLTLQLLIGWNQAFARPPMAEEGPVSVVASVEAVAAWLVGCEAKA